MSWPRKSAAPVEVETPLSLEQRLQEAQRRLAEEKKALFAAEQAVVAHEEKRRELMAEWRERHAAFVAADEAYAAAKMAARPI